MGRKELLILMVSLLVALAIFLGLIFQVITQLPDVDTISSYIPSQTTKIYSSDGQTLTMLHREENRTVVPLSQISPDLQKAIIALEDARFFDHHGIDFRGIFRALISNIAKGEIVEGGSTITQQLARSLFLTRRKTIGRKLAEIILAVQIERKYTKEEILELYLNQVYWGHNAYGIEAAALNYFGKSAAELDLAESAMLAGIIRAPEIYSPHKNLEGAKLRQFVVLDKMVELAIISADLASAAKAQEIKLVKRRRTKYQAPYFTSYVIAQLIQKYGENMIYNGGLKVYTTLDMSMQGAAEESTTKFVEEEGEKYNFSQVALLALDSRTGYIKAMVGGASFEASEFNRAVQSHRQPGSAFKPFIYTAAMESGVSPGFTIEDSAVTFEVPTDKWNPKGVWRPQNFDKKFRGLVTVRQALEKSLNVPSIKLLDQVGIGGAIAVARKMGIKSPLKRHLGLVLGASEVTLLEMVSAYGVFANSGVRVEPVSILKVEGRDGEILEKHRIEEKRVLDSNICHVMVDLMKGVILRGTGVRGRIDREAAAKTGTTEEFRDAWFIGYVPQLSAGVWVGNDDNESMKGVAEVAVCPRIWKSFMKQVLAEEPIVNFPKPKGLTKAQICLDSGLLATSHCPQDRIVTDTFWADSHDKPNDECDIHHPEAPPSWLENLLGGGEEEEEEEDRPPEWLRPHEDEIESLKEEESRD